MIPVYLLLLLDDAIAEDIVTLTTDYVIHARGRQPIGVDQPEGGHSYPFVTVPEEVADLVADFYLSYTDPTCQLTPPFRISKLWGFGGTPEFVNLHDIRIKDSNDLDVLDSRDGASYASVLWDDRLLIIEWQTATVICRLVVHIAWKQADVDAGIAHTYDNNISITGGQLVARTYERRPDQVTSINGIAAQDVVLQNGYNTLLTDVTASTDTLLQEVLATTSLTTGTSLGTGKRRVTSLQLDCAPGTGLGQAPGCDGVEPVLKIFGGAKPDSAGKVAIDTEGILRFQRPVALTGAPARSYQCGVNTFTAAQARASLLLANDGQPCCVCSDYVRTYYGLQRQWNQWSDLAQDALDVRELYLANRRRWYLAKQQVEQNPLQITGSAIGGKKIELGAVYSNTTPCCLALVTLRFTLIPTVGTVTTPLPHAFHAKLAGPATCQKDVATTPAGSWPYWDFTFADLDSQVNARAAFRVHFPAYIGSLTVQPIVTVHFDRDLYLQCHHPVEVDPAVQAALTTAWGSWPTDVQAVSLLDSAILVSDASPYDSAHLD